MKLSIVIVNYKVKLFLQQCLISVLKSTENIDCEIFVVDNNSMDDSVEYLSPLFPQIKFISNNVNVGFARANNQAIRLSKGEYILLLNPDTLVGEKTISNVISFMDQTPDAGGVGVKMIDGTGAFLPESKRSMPTPWVSFCKIFGLLKLFPKSRIFGKYNLGYLDKDKIHQIDIMAGAFMMLRHEALNKSGLLDEAFFMYGEDIDLSYRIKLSGFINYYLPDKILHYKGESTPKHTIKYVKIFYEAMYIFFKKHNSGISLFYSLFINIAILFRAAIAAFYRLFFHFPIFRKTLDSSKNTMIIANENIINNLNNDLKKSLENRTVHLKKESKIDVLRTFIKSNNISEIILSDTLLKYDEMLDMMENLNDKNIIFGIHCKESNTIVSPRH